MVGGMGVGYDLSLWHPFHLKESLEDLSAYFLKNSKALFLDFIGAVIYYKAAVYFAGPFKSLVAKYRKSVFDKSIFPALLLQPCPGLPPAVSFSHGIYLLQT